MGVDKMVGIVLRNQSAADCGVALQLFHVSTIVFRISDGGGIISFSTGIRVESERLSDIAGVTGGTERFDIPALVKFAEHIAGRAGVEARIEDFRLLGQCFANFRLSSPAGPPSRGRSCRPRAWPLRGADLRRGRSHP